MHKKSTKYISPDIEISQMAGKERVMDGTVTPINTLSWEDDE